jgi:hypothetical protein
MNQSVESEKASLLFGLRACLVGLILGYCIVFPLKYYDLMPDRLTWLGLILAPMSMFGLLASLFAGRLWLGNRWWLLFFPMTVAAAAILLALNVSNWTR